MPLWLLPYLPKLIAGAALVLAAGLAVGWHASQVRRVDHAGYARAVAENAAAAAAATLQRQHDNEAEKARADQRTKQVEVDHDKILDSLVHERDAARAAIARAGGLRVPAAICAGRLPGAAASAGIDHDGIAGAVALPDATQDDLLASAWEADQITEVARECQNWIRAQGLYTAPATR